jgi:cystathionine beta-lyase/cystathionine gamma-synthase
MEGATAGFAFASGMAAYIQQWLLIEIWNHIVSSSSVLGDTFVVYQLFSKVEYSNIVF